MTAVGETLLVAPPDPELVEIFSRPHFLFTPASARLKPVVENWMDTYYRPHKDSEILEVKDSDIWPHINKPNAIKRRPFVGITAAHQLVEASGQNKDLSNIKCQFVGQVEGSRYALMADVDETNDGRETNAKALEHYIDCAQCQCDKLLVVAAEQTHVARQLLEREGFTNAVVVESGRSVAENMTRLYEDIHASVAIVQTRDTAKQANAKIVKDYLAYSDPSGLGRITLQAIWNFKH